MKMKRLLLLLIVIVAHEVNLSVAQLLLPSTKTIAPEFVEAYRGFALDILKTDVLVDRSQTFGATAASTFSLGYLLAVVKEKVYDIPTDGFDSALRISSDWINFAYKALTESLLDDSNIYVSSTIYSSNRSFVAPMGLKNLKTEVVYEDFSMPRVAVPSINGRIAVHTFGRIDDQLIPRGGWYGPSIWSFTKAVYVNTFIYKNKFVNKFADIGEGRFLKEKVRLLESAGDFQLRRTPDYTAVTLPFHDNRRSLVLVLPREDLNQLRPHLEEVLYSSRPEYLETKPLTLVLPALNFSMSNEFFSQLFHMGINNTMCNPKARNVNFLQPVAQALYTYLDHDKFEVASATGVQLNNNKEFHEALGIRQDDHDARREPLDEVEDETIRRSSGQADSEYETTVSATEEQQVTPTPVSKRSFRYLHDHGYSERISFTRPFFWYLNDNTLGPIFAGMVSSFESYRAESNSIAQGYDDLHKYQFWSCGERIAM